MENTERLSATLAVKKRNEAQPSPPRVYIATFGCQQNEADSERLLGLAHAMGYVGTDTPDGASLILLNTCAIREHAELKTLSVIGSFKRLKEQNPALIIGVCGCMAAEAHRVDELRRRYPYVDFTLTPAGIGELPMAILRRLSGDRRRFYLETDDTVLDPLPVLRTGGHRAYVSVMYGCNNFCSYCIVPYVRKRERSRPSGDVIAEVEGLVGDGVKDIMLLGQNVNSYRSDMDFPTLLSRLDAIPGEYVLRFMTSHPKDASDALIEVIAHGVHIEPHFHLPLQSGSDDVLSRMNRRYTLEKYMGVLERLRRASPDIAISSDIIVGFPGETEEDFECTMRALEAIRFDSVYSFLYSARRGTPAAEMEGQIPPDVAGERFTRLLERQAEISREKNLPLVGRDLRVLSDGVSKTDPSVQSGRTDAGKLVHFKAETDTVGKFITVHIDRAESFALYGTVIS